MKDRISPVHLYTDLGHYGTRVLTETGERAYFPSLAARSMVRIKDVQESTFKEPPMRLTQPGHWVVGELARAEMIGTPSIDAEWPLSEQYQALWYAAIASVLTTDATVQVWNGLPDQSRQLTGRIAQWMRKGHKIQLRNRREQKIRVEKAHFVDQGSATFLATLLNKKGEWKEDIENVESAVVDFGSRTVIWTTLNGWHRVGGKTLSKNLGAWEIEAAVRQAIDRQYVGFANRISEHSLMDIIIKKTCPWQGAEKDVSGIIDPILRIHADTVIAQCRRLWEGAETMRFYVAGGAWEMMYPYILKAYPHARCVDFPIWGQCIGEQRLHRFLLNG